MTKTAPPGFDPMEFTASEIGALRASRYVHFADRDGYDAPFGPYASQEPYFISASQPDVLAVAKHNREHGTRLAYWDRSSAFGPSDFKLCGQVLFRNLLAYFEGSNHPPFDWGEMGGRTIIGYERAEPAVCSAPPGEPSDEERAFQIALADMGDSAGRIPLGSVGGAIERAAKILAGYILKHEPDRLLSPEALAEKAKAAAYSRFAELHECYIPNDDAARIAHAQGWDDATAFLKGPAND